MADKGQLIGTAQAARELNRDGSYIHRMCRLGRIAGAQQLGELWFMPTPVTILPPGRARGRPKAREVEVQPASSGRRQERPTIDLALVRLPALTTRSGTDSIEHLARDIRARGLLHPITVRPVIVDSAAHYEVVTGTRRFEAVQALAARGRWQGGIPAHVAEMTDKEVVLTHLAENGVRLNVDVVTETRAIDTALRQLTDLRDSEVANALGISPEELRDRRRMLSLPPPALEGVRSGEITWPAARLMLSVVGGGHRHEAEILSALELLRENRIRPPYDVNALGYALENSLVKAGWVRVPSGPDASWAVRPLDRHFTHIVKSYRPHGETWTCRPDLLEKAKAEYVAETRQAAYRELVRKDPVVRRVSPAIHDPSDLTDRQSEQVGIRLSSLPSKGWRARIYLDGYWGPPTGFDKAECLTECVWGGVLTHRGLVCTNQKCFDGKVEASLTTPRRSALARRSRRHDERRRRALTSISISELTPQNATDLCIWLLGQGVALGKRVIADPNRYRDHTTRTETDEEQVEIQRLLGIGDGDPHCSECVWDLRDAQERARALDNDRTLQLLALLLSYALYRPLHSWIRLPAPSFLVTSPSVPVRHGGDTYRQWAAG